jgi:hypothetical protein
MVAMVAISSEVRIARMKGSFLASATYQRSEIPSGGKARNSPALSESSTINRIGVSRKT